MADNKQMVHEFKSFIVSSVEELANNFKNPDMNISSFKNETIHVLVKK